MQGYILRRVLQSLVTLLAVSIVIFGLARLTGDPIYVLTDQDMGPEGREMVRRAWGLDKPLPTQYFVYMGNVLQGNFGESLKWRGQSSGELLASRLPATLQLASVSLLVATLLAVPIGVFAAVKRDTGVDQLVKLVGLLGQSVPSFWMGIVLMWIFSVNLGLLPTSGMGGLQHLVLPAVTLGLLPVAAGSRLVRSSMLDVLDTEYVKLARIKGIPESRVIWKHCLRNACLAPVTYFGLILAGFMGGSVVIETVFSWPGVGLLSIEAIQSRDFPVVQTVVLFFAFLYVMCTLLVDVLYGYLDPRIRLR